MAICTFSERFHAVEKGVQAAENYAEYGPPVGNEEVGDGHHQQGRCGQVGAEALEHFLECRDDENHDHRGDNECHDDDGDRVEERGLDLALDRDNLFLVGCKAFEQGVQDAGLFAGGNEVAVERVEIQRILAECLRQRAAGLDVGLDVEQELGDRRVGVSATDDVESLKQGHA